MSCHRTTFSTPGAFARLRARNKNIFNRLKAFIESAHDNSTSKEGKKALNKVLKSFDKALDASRGGVLLTDLRDDEEKENTEQEHGVGDERNSRITEKMTEKERADILRTEIIHPHLAKVVKEGFDWDALIHNKKSRIEKSLIKRLRELGLIRAYKTDAIDIEFEFTVNGLRKSLNSQVSDYGGNLADLAKVVMNMQELLDISVLIEIHKDKAKGSDRENPRLYRTYVLMSAFYENREITPVQFEIKQYIDNQNRLYLAVALTKIEIDVMGDTALQKEGRTHLLPISNISIPSLIEKINTRDENFFKYIPDELLNESQIKAKQRALEKEAYKYGKTVQNNERNSKKAEGRGVTWSDLEPDITVQAEDSSDIRVHPPAPKKKASKNTESDKAPKVEPKKEAKKPKRPLKVTKALTDDEAHNILAYIMEDHFKGITEDTKTAYLPGTVRKDVQNRLTHIANTNDTEAYVGKVYDIAELICNEAIIREQYDISDRADVDEARRAVDILDSYKGKINLEAIREDIKSKYDTRAPHLIRAWGAKKTRGVSTDVIKEELAEYGIKIDSINEADIFTDMIAKYDQAKGIIEDAEKSIATKVKDLFKDDADGKALLIENVANDLHTLFNKNIEREYFKTYSKVLSVCRKFNDLKKGTYINATKEEDNYLKTITT